MAHNFRLTGDIYVSKAGNDANNGLTKDTPKATIYGGYTAITAIAQTIIIGAGVYEENISRIGNNTNLKGDGNVKIRGNGSNVFNVSNGGQGFTDITFENYATMNCTTVSSIVRCTFLNIPNIIGAYAGAVNCIFINCTMATGATLTCSYCIFINTYARIIGCNSSYFNSASALKVSATSTGSIVSNNIMGPIVSYNGTTYADLSAFKADNAISATNFNLPPKFNNVYKYDFTLQYDSPHIGTASDGVSNIGGTSYAKVSDMFVSPEWQIANGAVYSKNNGADIALNAAEADIVYDGQDLVLAVGKTKGHVIPAPVKVAANPQVLQGINLNGIGYFNKSANNGSLMNDNVPDADAYPAALAGAAGANPDRLSYGFRFTDADTQPGSDVDWLNGYNGTAGAFVLLELFGKPMMNSNGIGCGSPLYDPASGIELSVVWVQPKITLTRLYA